VRPVGIFDGRRGRQALPFRILVRERDTDLAAGSPFDPATHDRAAAIRYQLEIVGDADRAGDEQAGACVRQVADRAIRAGPELVEGDLPSLQDPPPGRSALVCVSPRHGPTLTDSSFRQA
jgi:hypothetical protein